MLLSVVCMTQGETRGGYGIKALAVASIVTAGVMVTAGGVWAVGAVSEFFGGRTFPQANPAATAGRLQDHSQLVRATVELPQLPVESNYVDTGACYGGGWTKIDVAVDGVVSVGHHWQIPHVSQQTAQAAMDRVRARFASERWKQISDNTRHGANWTDLGFRMEDPKNGDKLDLAWNNYGSTLIVNVYAPCAKVSADFSGNYENPVASPREL